MANLQRDASRLHGLDGLLEFRKLHLRIGFIPAIRHREMREHALDLDTRQLLHRRREHTDLLGAHADAAHARLDLEVHLANLMPAHGLLRQSLREFELTHDLRHIVIDDRPGILRAHNAQEQDRRRKTSLPQLNGLGDRRHREIRRTALDSHARHGDRAMPIGIRLHHRAELRPAADIPLDRLIIRSDRPKVNFRPGRPIRHTTAPFRKINVTSDILLRYRQGFKIKRKE